MEEDLYTQSTTCPLCRHTFDYYGVRSSAVRVDGYDSDFHTRFKGRNPDHYAVIVCPRCWYADMAAEFSKLTSMAVSRLSALPNLRLRMRDQGMECDFSRPRTVDAVRLSLTLALQWFTTRKAPPHRIAETWLRAAWIEREVGRATEERAATEKAIEWLERAYQSGEANESELRLQYLIFDLALRLDRLDQASLWADMLIKDSLRLNASPRINRMFRERMGELREARQLAGMVREL